MTNLALTYGAGVFDYGINYYGNSDWSLYDTHYTERYMDSPAENPEGYKRTAVKTYLHQYKGMLRIIHGNSDNNVHPQHSLEIVNQLQEMGKHFEFILYPVCGMVSEEKNGCTVNRNWSSSSTNIF